MEEKNILQMPGSKMASPKEIRPPKEPKNLEINVSPAAQKYLADMRKLASDMGKYTVIPAMTIRKLYFRLFMVAIVSFALGLGLGWIFFK